MGRLSEYSEEEQRAIIGILNRPVPRYNPRRAYDQRERCILTNGTVSIWTLAMFRYSIQYGGHIRYGTALAVFDGDRLEAAICNGKDGIDSFIYHRAVEVYRKMIRVH